MNQNAAADDIQNQDDITNHEINQMFKPKSKWRPNPPNKTLDTFQQAFKTDLRKTKIKSPRHQNLTKEERLGLKPLHKNNKIIIKKEDKGSAVVVINTTDNLRKGYRQLQDTNFYQSWT